MMNIFRHSLTVLVAAWLVLAIEPMVYAATNQTNLPPEGDAIKVEDVNEANNEKEKPARSYNYKTIPYLNYGRNFGAMAGVIPVFMFKPNSQDKISQPSLAGGYGIYTSNDTWSAGGFAKLFLNEDKWRVTIAAVTGNINSQYVDPVFSASIDYSAATDGGFFGINRRISKHNYIGLNYTFASYDNTFDTPSLEPIETKTSLHGVGVVFDSDSRPNIYYPRSGHRVLVKYTSYPKGLGNSESTQIARLIANKYFPIKNSKDTVAVRIYGGIGIGNITFNKELILGRVDLRGYTQGEYRGKQLIAAQAEYRHYLNDKLGIVGFAGLGSIFGSVVEENNGDLLPSIGAGIRYKIFPETGLNAGFDLAAGKGDWGVTFRIGESF